MKAKTTNTIFLFPFNFFPKRLNESWQSEAEDDQHTQVCGLDIENISLQCSFCEVLLVLVLVQINNVHKPIFSSGEHLPNLGPILCMVL
jgi:hypothetical protein